MKLNDERRQHYRVTDLSAYGLACRLLIGGFLHPVRLADVSFAGAGLLIRNVTGIVLRPGQGITLRFDSRHLPAPVETPAVVGSRSPEGDCVRYGVAFRNPKELQRRMTPRVIGAFNRRRSFRVTPDSARPLCARVVHDTDTFDREIICISASGCAVIERSSQPQSMSPGDTISLTFDLPESSKPCRIVGTVRYALEQPVGVRYGIEFDVEKTVGFTGYEAIITRYVMKQQRRMVIAA